MAKHIRKVVFVVILVAVAAFVLMASDQELRFSYEPEFGYTTDTTGDESDVALFYARYSVCPIEISLEDPWDTTWEDAEAYYGTGDSEADETFDVWDRECGLTNTGCVVIDITLNVDLTFCPGWTTSSAPTVVHGIDKFLLWVLAKGGHRHPGSVLPLAVPQFWPFGDKEICVVGTSPEAITTERFFNPSFDWTPFLVPPMDTLGMHLYPNKSFWLYMLFQGPLNLSTGTDTSGTIILNVVGQASVGP